MGNVTSLDSFRQFNDSESALSLALKLRTQGKSVSNIAAQLNIPRSTLRDKLTSHDEILLPESVKAAFATHDGWEFLKRLCISAHVCFRNSCECGLRVLSMFFKMTGLDALIGGSLGCQWKFGTETDEAIVEFGEEELHRIAPAVAGKEITAAVDENFHEGPCLIAIEPVSNFILTETLAENRDTKSWEEAMLPILATLGVKVVQVTSDSGSSILSLCKNVFEAHHSPDLFHIIYDFRRCFMPSIRIVRRAIERELNESETEEDAILKMASTWQHLPPSERGSGRPPNFNSLLLQEQKRQAELFSRLSQVHKYEQDIGDSLTQLSQNYHPVCLKTGKRTGAASFQQHLAKFSEQARIIISELYLADFASVALEKFERMGVKMLSTLEMIAATWHSCAAAECLNAKEAFALEVYLAPAAYLERLAYNSRTLDAYDLEKTAAGLRTNALNSHAPERISELNSVAKKMADDFQRSSSMVEGRNGALSLRHHAFHELSPLKRTVLTVMHNFVTLRHDGTTAGERFSGERPRCLIEWLCERIQTLPKAGGKRIISKVA